MEKATVLKALVEANAAPFAPARISGCGRAYVCVGGLDKAGTKVLAEACKALGLLFNPKGHYGVGRCSIYIGYDNADGRALGKSKVFAQVLNQHGIPAYDDAASD